MRNSQRGTAPAGLYAARLLDLFSEVGREELGDERSPLLKATAGRGGGTGGTPGRRTWHGGGDNGNGDEGEGDIESLFTSSSSVTHPHKGLPWYKRPSPWWVILVNPFIGIPITACVAAKVQLYTKLVCMTVRPEFATGPSTASSSISIFTSLWNLPKLSEPSELCLTDPVVQASVATLMAAMGTTIGILSILSTIAWGELSDRKGRTPFLGLTVFGTCLADITFILVSYFHPYLPGGYHWLLLGYVLEGLTGGMTTAVAANNAYIADCSEAEGRSRFFSLNLGIFCIGIALGPTLGGWFISSTGDLLSVFFMSAGINLGVALFYWGVVPESLGWNARGKGVGDGKGMAGGGKGRRGSWKTLDEEDVPAGKGNDSEGEEISDARVIWIALAGSLSMLSMFYPGRITRSVVLPGDEESSLLSPLSPLSPSPLSPPDPNSPPKHTAPIPDSRSRTRSGNSNSGIFRAGRDRVEGPEGRVGRKMGGLRWKERKGRDWNMMFLAGGVLLAALAVAAYSFMFEYMGAQFHWRSEQLGYYLTLTGATRTVHLMVLLPLATKFFKPSSLSAPSYSSSPTSSSSSSLDPTTRLLHFDLTIARISLLLSVLGFASMALVRSPALFLLGAMGECLGSGFPAAIQSAALEIYRRSGHGGGGSGDGKGKGEGKGDETGKLFAALSVMQSVGSQIIGPSLFGSVYTTTVSSFPQAIFLVAAAAMALSVIVTLPIRTRSPVPFAGDSEDVDEYGVDCDGDRGVGVSGGESDSL